MTSKTKKIVIGGGLAVGLLLLWRRFAGASGQSNASLNLNVLSKPATLTTGGGGLQSAGSLSGTTLSGNALVTYGKRQRAGSLS